MADTDTATLDKAEAPDLEHRHAHLAARRRNEVFELPTTDRRGFMVRRLSVIGDLVALVLVGIVATACLRAAGRQITSLDLALFLVFFPLWPVIGVGMRVYHPHSVGRGLSITTSDEFATVFRVTTIWSWFFIVARSVASAEPIQVLPSLLVWALSVPLILIARSSLRRVARSRGWYRQTVLVIGRVQDAAQIISRIHRHPEWGLSVVREVDVATDQSMNSDELVDLADRMGVSRVIFATPPAKLDARTDLTRALIEAGRQVDFVPGEAEILRSGAEISHLEGLPLMSMPGARPPRSWGILKRGMDLAVGIPVLIVAAPVIIYSAIRIKRDSPGPVFYRQRRAGLDGRPFDFLKLRTMSDDAEDRLEDVADLSLHGIDSGTFKAVADPRITAVGASLRRRSLDELPQLLNVVKGDMSLVGPRPLPVAEDQRVAGHYELRRHTRPGMTGPWQVSGRSDIPFQDMLRLDYSYVLNWSLSSDLKLLLQTVNAVIRGRGAY